VLSSSEERSSWGVRSGGSSRIDIPNGSLLLLPCVTKGRLLGPATGCRCSCLRIPAAPVGEPSERLLAAALRSPATPRRRLTGAGAGTGGLHTVSSEAKLSSITGVSPSLGSVCSTSCPLVCASLTPSAKAFGMPALMLVINRALLSNTS